MDKTTLSAILAVTILAGGVYTFMPVAFGAHKPTEVLVQVRDATTGTPEAWASCNFTFDVSGIVGPLTANPGGVAKATGTAGDTTVDVSCTDAAGLGVGSSGPTTLKVHGTTVVTVLTT